MIQIILFVIAVSAYENYEGCSTKTFNYTEYGYSDVEDLYNQFTCEGARQGSFSTKFKIKGSHGETLTGKLVTKTVKTVTNKFRIQYPSSTLM